MTSDYDTTRMLQFFVVKNVTEICKFKHQVKKKMVVVVVVVVVVAVVVVVV